MPLLLQHIDAIAREKKRDVLFLGFGLRDEQHVDFDDYEPDADPARRDVMAWLVEHQISHQLCANVANVNCMGGWRGEIYLDVPADPQDAQYQTLSDYFETSDGVSRIPCVRLYLLPLALAMKNAHHDEPGFWEEQAKSW